jgi:hypothetical protein
VISSRSVEKAARWKKPLGGKSRSVEKVAKKAA